MTEYPLLCINPRCRPEEHGGPRRTERAWFCPDCIAKARTRLHQIASKWADLEDNLTSSEVTTDRDQGKAKNGGKGATGVVVNERVVEVRARATRDLWSYARMVFDWADEQDRTIASPARQTVPGLAHWIADRHIAVFAVHAGRYTAVAFIEDVWSLSSAVHSAAYPSGARKVETGLRCVEHDTSPEGERVECVGEMVAWVRPDVSMLPDLVCTMDRQHTLNPLTWQRLGWRKAHAGGMDPDAAQRFADGIALRDA